MTEIDIPEDQLPDFEEAIKAQKKRKMKPERYPATDDVAADDGGEDDSFYTACPDEFKG